jgi:hypothetical protein
VWIGVREKALAVDKESSSSSARRVSMTGLLGLVKRMLIGQVLPALEPLGGTRACIITFDEQLAAPYVHEGTRACDQHAAVRSGGPSATNAPNVGVTTFNLPALQRHVKQMTEGAEESDEDDSKEAELVDNQLMAKEERATVSLLLRGCVEALAHPFETSEGCAARPLFTRKELDELVELVRTGQLMLDDATLDGNEDYGDADGGRWTLLAACQRFGLCSCGTLPSGRRAMTPRDMIIAAALTSSRSAGFSR